MLRRTLLQSLLIAPVALISSDNTTTTETPKIKTGDKVIATIKWRASIYDKKNSKFDAKTKSFKCKLLTAKIYGKVKSISTHIKEKENQETKRKSSYFIEFEKPVRLASFHTPVSSFWCCEDQLTKIMG